MPTIRSELDIQVPCLLRCKTHTVGGIRQFSVNCTVRERPRTVLIGANRTVFNLSAVLASLFREMPSIQ